MAPTERVDMPVFGPVERLINTTLAPIRRRLNNIVRRAVVDLVNDNRMVAELQLVVMGGETQNEIENFEHYGFTSRLPPGTEIVLLRLGAAGDHQVAIASAFRSKAAGVFTRPNLPDSADVAVWDLRGQIVKLIDGKIVIEPKGVGRLIELGEGATKRVARVGDVTALDSAMVAWIGLVSTATGVAVPTTTGGAITTGSAVVTAVD